MKKGLCAIALLLLFAACDLRPAEQRPENLNSKSSSAGVVVHGYASPGWIENTNPFPVRIKQVWIFRGEFTEWINEFQPGEKKHQYISHQHGFYIYSLDGAEIGWIRPEQNGSREQH